MKQLYLLLTLTACCTAGAFGQTYFSLSGGPFSQNWTNTSLITANDVWTGVPSIIGYLGNDGTTTIAPILADTAVGLAYSDTIDVIANQTAPNTNTTGGVAEFELANPVVALQGSGNADAPNLIIYLNATGVTNIRVRYLLRDIDGSADNSVQPVALQYRIGATGNFINIPAAFVADASGGPSEATKETLVDVILPSECNNQTQLELRIITGNAQGTDEWIGIDDIEITPNSTSPVSNIIRDPNYVKIAGLPSDLMTVQFNRSIASDVTVQIINSNGQVVMQKRMGRVTAGQTESMQFAQLPKGMYTLSISSKEGVFTRQLVH